MKELNIHEHIYNRLDVFYEKKNIPNIIFHGSSGSGKKTIVYNFLNKIYDNNKQKLKTNVMVVNCSHGKGIKFIREDLKFFAKSNMKYSENINFKTIILLNGDSLTNDAQSALRRCIELFSYNTRFFIIVENKNNLLNPIVSRFCEIFVPEYQVNDKIINLHNHFLNNNFDNSYEDEEKYKWFCENIIENQNHEYYFEKSNEIYELGYSCIDLMNYIEKNWDSSSKALFFMCFHKVKSQFKCEKLLLLYMLDFMFIRDDKVILT